MQNFSANIFASSIVFLVFLIIIALIYFWLSSRGVKKQKQFLEQMHKDLKVGQKVMFAGGLFGKLRRVGNETCDIEVSQGTVIEVSRYAIQEIVK